jgi:hypothetical protein
MRHPRPSGPAGVIETIYTIQIFFPHCRPRTTPSLLPASAGHSALWHSHIDPNSETSGVIQLFCRADE